MSFAVQFYDFSVWLHVSAVVVGFGATFAESITFPLAMKVGVRHLPFVHRLGIAINQYMATPALVLIIITGIYQTSDRWDFGDFWISATFLIALILGGLNGAYFIPGERRLAAQVEREIAAAGDGDVVLSAEYQRKARQMGMVGALAGVLVLVAIFLMVAKPGA